MKKNIIIFILLVLVVFFGFNYFKAINNNFESKYKINNDINNISGKSNFNKSIYDNKNINVSSEFLNEVFLYKKGKKLFSQEIKTIFGNIDYYLKNRTDNTLALDEIYYPISSVLLYPFINNSKQCDYFVNNYGIKNKNYFLKECNFVIESKKVLIEKKDIEKVPEYLREYNRIFNEIKNKKSEKGSILSLLLFKDYTKEEVFKLFDSYISRLNKKEVNKLIINLSPVIYGIYSYNNDIHKLKLKKIKELFYYKSVLFRAMYKGLDNCNLINNDNYKKYCIDIVAGKNKEYYKKLYKEFFIYLYLNVKGI